MNELLIMASNSIQIVEMLYENIDSVKSALKKLREFYGLHNRSSKRIIGRNNMKFKIGLLSKSENKVVVVVHKNFRFGS